MPGSTPCMRSTVRPGVCVPCSFARGPGPWPRGAWKPAAAEGGALWNLGRASPASRVSIRPGGACRGSSTASRLGSSPGRTSHWVMRAVLRGGRSRSSASLCRRVGVRSSLLPLAGARSARALCRRRGSPPGGASGDPAGPGPGGLRCVPPPPRPSPFPRPVPRPPAPGGGTAGVSGRSAARGRRAPARGGRAAGIASRPAAAASRARWCS